MKTRAAFTKTMHGRAGQVPLPGPAMQESDAVPAHFCFASPMGTRGKNTSSTVALALVILRCPGLIPRSVFRAIPSVPEGPGTGKRYGRPLRPHAAAPGTYRNARPAFADSLWSQRGPPHPLPSPLTQVLPFGQSMGQRATAPVRFYFRHVFSSKSRARNKSYLVVLRTPQGARVDVGGLAEARRGGAYGSRPLHFPAGNTMMQFYAGVRN